MRAGCCRNCFQLPSRCAAMVFLVNLSACSLGPAFVPPEAPPVSSYLPTGHPRDEAGLRVRYGTVQAQWWELFQSAPLNELVEKGIRHNPDLEAAAAAVRVAQANALAQRGALFPQIAANWESSRSKASNALQPAVTSGQTLYSLHTAQVTVGYVADVWGGVRRQIESLEALAENQVFQREAIHNTLAANIALAAIDEASLRGQIDATRRIISAQSQLLSLLRRQQELGQIALPDVLVQETAVAQARLLLPALEKRLEEKRHLLAVLTGQFPGNAALPSFNLKSLRLPRELPLSVPGDLVRQRPDVRAAEANVHAASAQVGVAIANRFPQIALSANTGSTAEQISRLLNPGTGFWSVAGNVLQPLFDGGALAYKQAAAEEGLVQAKAQYRSVVLTAFQNVADALQGLQASGRAVSAASAAENTARQTVDVIRSQIERGQVNVSVLIPAQKAYLEASLANVEAQADRRAAVVALLHALGGGWWNRSGAALATQ